KTGWLQGYNAQVLVEETSGVIVAHEVVAHSADSPRLLPIIDCLEANLEALAVPIEQRIPHQVFSADARYCSERILAALEQSGLNAYVVAGRKRHYRRRLDPHGRPRTPLRSAM